MLASRHYLLIPTLFCLLTASALAQESREWTDKGGKKLTGTFVELITKDSKELVKIQGDDGKPYSIPLNVFSEADQQYVKQTVAKQNKPDSPPVKDELDEDRLWTNFQGRSLTARFANMKDGYVYLIRGNKGQPPISFYLLSQDDQDWLRKQLALRGEANKILPREVMERVNPTIHKELDEYMSKLAATSGKSDSSPMQPSNPLPPAGAPYVPPSESTPTSNGGDPNFQSPGGGQPAGMQPGENDLAANDGQPMESTSPETGTESPSFPDRFSSNPAQDVEPGHCPGCRLELPTGYGPGDHCPRCNFFLEEWVQPGTGAPLVAWYQSSTLWYTVGGLLIVLGILAVSAKKFSN
ncbi:hypothetical protein DTL42_05050 [Bremerella cremea]|uniref:SLA1 homology domain-containing protein n=1 Tax=Bremerella cremea TaxID=1031537 RepID=A0A368KVX2_9BACT|nr:hypothetical protein [Bremerella cremea]RCS54509.1 hypothetical protein DTL42_05050 [Bremerella cremea]